MQARAARDQNYRHVQWASGDVPGFQLVRGGDGGRGTGEMKGSRNRKRSLL